MTADEGVAYGDFWIEDDLYDVVVRENKVLGEVEVEIENLEQYETQSIEKKHVMTGKGRERTYAGTEDSAGLPQDNSELEAYVLKALNQDGNYSF